MASSRPIPGKEDLTGRPVDPPTSLSAGAALTGLADVPGLPAALAGKADAAALAGLAARTPGSRFARAMGDRIPLATPPTVTVNASAATTLTNTKFTSAIAAGNPFRIAGMDTGISASLYLCALGETNSVTAGTGVRTNDLANPFSVAFDFDGQAFELDMNVNAGVTFRVWVDEQVGPFVAPGTGGVTGRRSIKVDFGTRALRRVVVEFNPQAYLAGIYAAKTDSIVPPSSANTRKLAIVGDSYAAGQGAEVNAVSALGYVHRLAHLLGYLNYRDYAVSGTGFTKDAGTTGTYGVKYATRISDLISYAPDDVLIQGSGNDNGAAGLPAAVTAYLNAVTTALPNARIILVTSPRVLIDAATIANAADLATGRAAAAKASSIGFVDATSAAFFSGTGKVGATVGDGNNDFYQSGISAAHASAAGYDYIARRLAPMIAPLWGISL